MSIDITTVNKELAGKTAFDIIHWCYANFPAEKIMFSNSFGAEDMALHHILVSSIKNPRIFTLDTGRMFQETYDVWEDAVEKYGVPVETYFPKPEGVAELVQAPGPNLFYKSIENRKGCCGVRKIEPLKRALSDADLWITGLRREQSGARSDAGILEVAAAFGCTKVSPLLDWTEANVWEYIRNNGVPYNKLHDKGYPSIGCAPCTRPVRPAEDWRGGRWWWESDDTKECGLHAKEPKQEGKPKNYSI